MSNLGMVAKVRVGLFLLAAMLFSSTAWADDVVANNRWQDDENLYYYSSPSADFPETPLGATSSSSVNSDNPWQSDENLYYYSSPSADFPENPWEATSSSSTDFSEKPWGATSSSSVDPDNRWPNDDESLYTNYGAAKDDNSETCPWCNSDYNLLLSRANESWLPSSSSSASGVVSSNSSGTVSNPYNAGSVVTSSSGTVGGVIANTNGAASPNDGTVTNPYNTGSVVTSSSGTVGGVIANTNGSASLAPISYLDENGDMQYCTEYTVLTNNTDISNLSAGWYVVEGSVSYTSALEFNYGDVNLILADNAKLSVDNNENLVAISASSMTIYAQSVGDNMGKLSTTAVGYGLYADNTLSIYGGNVTATARDNGSYGFFTNGYITINGGSVTATAGEGGRGLHAQGGISINGGSVTATVENSGYGLFSNGYIFINGGDVTAMAGDNGHGLHADCDTAAVILGYSSATDFIKASNYYGRVKIVDGKAFMDGNGKVYSGTLTSEQLSAIVNEKLIPAVPYLDEKGETKYCTNFTLLTNETNVSGDLPGGWYVVGEKDVSYYELKFNGDVNLILADESNLSLNVNAQGGADSWPLGMATTGSLTIYAQSVGDKMGKLSAMTRYNSFALHAGKNITIIGGNITAVAEKEYGKAINVSDGNITIIGGNVMATAVDKASGLYVDSGNIIFIGGNVKASNYRAQSVKIADGKAFMDEKGNVYSGTLTSEQLSTIAGKKLIPAVPYLDEKGETKYCTNFTVLTNDTDISNLSGGWYVVDSKVSYASTLSFDGDVNLILADGAELSVNYDYGWSAIFAPGLTIYAQSVGDNMGKLSTTGDYGLFADNITINGGNVTATAGDYGLFADRNIAIIGGNVTATAGDDGFYASNIITLGYSFATDFINASSYQANSVKITTGKFFKDDENYIYGSESPLTDEQLSAIAGKTLRPATALKVVWNLKMGDNSITPEKLFKSFSGDYAFAGDVVSFSLNEGFNLVTTNYNDGGDHEITQNDGIYSFTMPATGVTVTAEVQKLLTHSDITVAEIRDTTYTGKAITPEVVVKDGETALDKETDYSVEYSNNVDVGTATVTITGKGGYSDSRTVSFKIASKSIASENITVAEIDNQTWTGKAITLNVTVKYGETELAKDKDYELSYENNTNAGMATITITGKGGYDGTRTATFNIVKFLKSDGMAFAKIADQEWTGEEIKPEVVVKDGEEKTLVKGRDYTIEYLNNIDMGSAEARISGSGYYTDDTVVTFNIFKSIAHKDISVAEIDNQTWTGEERKPEVTVKDGETALDKKTDYSVEYSNNTDAGTATVTITGKGNYFKSKTVTFKIIKSLEHESITIAQIEPQAYTGAAITPKITVKDGEEKTLVKDKDYELTYSNNEDVGTATVTITGKGNYTDTKEVEFKIAKSIGDDNSNITVAQIKDQPKTGEAITPEVIVKDGETALKKDQDYTLSYSDNVNAGTGKVIITGINGYVGSRTVTFRIYDPADVVEYLDENGEKQTASGCYEIVAAEGSTAGGALPEKDGCYVVKGEVSYKDNFNFGYNDVKLILTDGAKLTVENTTSSIWLNKLSIYAQSTGENMGRFEVSSNGTGLNVQEMTVNGGFVTVSGNIGIAIGMYGSLTINGGVVNVTSNGTGEDDAAILVGVESSFEVNGGSVTAKASSGRDVLTSGKLSLNGGTVVAEGNGIEAAIPGTASSTYAYGVKFAGATVKAASYKLGSKVDYGSLYEAKISIAEGLFYTDGEGNSYTAGENGSINVVGFDGKSATFSQDMIAGQNMHPYIPAIQFREFTKDNGTTGKIVDFNGSYGENVPLLITESMERMEVDSVEFKRSFVSGQYATVMFPFNVYADNLIGALAIDSMSYLTVEVVNGKKVVKAHVESVWSKSTSAKPKKACDNTSDDCKKDGIDMLMANHPYMVQMEKNITELKIRGAVKLVTNEPEFVTRIGDSEWEIVGMYHYKKWAEDDSELLNGRAIYGFVGEEVTGFKIGHFVRCKAGVYINPMRAYMRYNPLPPPQGIARYGVANWRNSTASIDLPESIIIVRDGNSEAVEKQTTTIGRFNTRTGEIKLNPAGDRVYDLKGRSIRKDAKKAKGAYYGKKK